MSWAASQYDDNPFSDNSAETASTIKAPLTKAAPLVTPPWLQDSRSESSNSNTTLPAASEPVTNSNSGDVDPSIPRMILYTRVINLTLSVCMIIVSLLSLLTTQTATTGVLACYVVVFSCLLCCFETHLKQVSKLIALNFGFMYSAKARCIFMLFIGTILFSFSLFGKLVGCFMIANAAFNAYILCKYPQYEDAQRMDATSEIQDYLEKHPAFRQKMYETGMKAGTDLIKNNPDIARQGAEALLSSAAASSSQRAQDDRGVYAQV